VKNIHIAFHRAIWGAWQWQRTFYKLSLRRIDVSTMPDDELLEMFDTMDLNGDGLLHFEDNGLKDAGMTNLSARSVRAMFEIIETLSDKFACLLYCMPATDNVTSIS
jgi:hypothetical protein